jgi:hypothetical protein
MGNRATLITLKAKTKEETNSIADPKKIVPVATTIEGVGETLRRTVPGHSIQVLEIGWR